METFDEVPEFGLDIRQKFMLDENTTFLNHGSFGCKPRCVHNRQIRYLEEMERNPDVWFRYKRMDYLASAVAKVAEYMGTRPTDTFLLQNVTKATNTVLKTFPLQPGDAYLINSLAYTAVETTSHAVTARVEGAETYILDITFPIKSQDDVIELYDTFLTNHPNVKVAIIDHITCPAGVLLPVKKLTEVLHHHNVIVVVDGAHAPGQLDVDIQDIDCDFYTGTLHKWMYTPRGCTFLWMNPRRKHNWFKPLVTSYLEGRGLDIAFSFEGTNDDTPYFCAIDGIDFYNRIGGRDRILSYIRALKTKGVAYLEERWGTRRLDVPDDMVAPNMQMVTLPFIPGFSEYEDKDKELQKLILERFDIQVMIKTVNNALMARVSAQVYNTMDDFVKLAEAVLILARNKQ